MIVVLSDVSMPTIETSEPTEYLQTSEPTPEYLMLLAPVDMARRSYSYVYYIGQCRWSSSMPSTTTSTILHKVPDQKVQVPAQIQEAAGEPVPQQPQNQSQEVANRPGQTPRPQREWCGRCFQSGHMMKHCDAKTQQYIKHLNQEDSRTKADHSCSTRTHGRPVLGIGTRKGYPQCRFGPTTRPNRHHTVLPMPWIASLVSPLSGTNDPGNQKHR